jgi:hypothetical protein
MVYLGTELCILIARIAANAMHGPTAAIERRDVGEYGPAEPTSPASRGARSQTLNG